MQRLSPGKGSWLPSKSLLWHCIHYHSSMSHLVLQAQQCFCQLKESSSVCVCVCVCVCIGRLAVMEQQLNHQMYAIDEQNLHDLFLHNEKINCPLQQNVLMYRVKKLSPKKHLTLGRSLIKFWSSWMSLLKDIPCGCCCLVAKSNSFVTPWMQLTRLLCPQDFPGKNPGMGGPFLLQRIFPTQGLNSSLLLGRQILYC